jgi:hypothetical protein
MAKLSENIEVLRVYRNEAGTTTEFSEEDDHTTTTTIPQLIPELDERIQGHYQLYISARMKKVNDFFCLGGHYRLYFNRPGFHEQGMRFYHFVDRQQVTQLALKRVLEYIETNDIAFPRTITIITDELEATRFLENATCRVNETEHAIVEYLRSMNCKLTIKRPSQGDAIFRTITRNALQECTSSRTVTFLVYNKKYIKRIAHSWSQKQFRAIYRQSANLTMRQFFPTPDIPDFVTIDFVLSQFFTGHGRFRDYLVRFGALIDGGCTHCDGVVEQTARHTLLDCPTLSEITRRTFELAGLMDWTVGLNGNLNHLFRLVETPEAFEMFKRAAHHIHFQLNISNRTQ